MSVPITEFLLPLSLPGRHPFVELPWPGKYPCRIDVTIQWPWTIEHKGRTFYNSSKEGKRLSDGCPCAQYGRKDTEGEYRIWLHLDGEIAEG
jgi:hypothetical protein